MRISISILIIVLFSCRESGKFNSLAIIQNNQIEVREKLKKYKCNNEYDFARLFLYSIYYKELCMEAICMDSFPVPLNSTYLISTDFRLNLNRESSIREVGDTLIFEIRAFSNDSLNCICSNSTNFSLPFEIYIKRNSKVILVEIGYDGSRWYPTKTEVDNILNNKEMLDFVKKNKQIISPWFYSELIKQGHLKF